QLRESPSIVLRQLCHAFGQQPILEFDMPRAEIGQCVVIYGAPSANPLKSQFRLTTTVEFSSTADSPQRRVQPQCHENAGVDRRLAAPALDGLDLPIQRREVLAADEIPNDARLVPLGQQIVPTTRAKRDLIPAGRFES